MIKQIREFFVDRKVVDDIAKKYLAENIERAVALMASDLRSVSVIAPPDPEVLDKIITLEMAYKDAYMLNTTVAACVNFICDSVSSVPFVLKERDKKGIVTDVDHAAVQRLNNPNEYQDRILFVKVFVQHLLLCGNTLIYKNKEFAGGAAVAKISLKGPIKSLEVFDPDDFDVFSDGRRILKYVVKKHILENEKTKDKYPKNEFEPKDIIHIVDNPDPKRPYWGIGRIQAAYRSIDVDSQIVSWWLETMKNGCRKDVLLKFKKDLGENQFRRIKRQVEQQLAGFKNGRGFMILGREHDVEFLNQSPAEMDFSTNKKDTAKDIMSIFRVPSLLLYPEHSGFNNQAEARKAFWLDNILMLCNMVANGLNKYYLSEFTDLTNRDVWLTYDFSKVDALMRQYIDLTKCAIDLVGIGHSRDEVNRILDMGWNSGPGSDKNYVSANLISEEERDQKMKLAEEAVKIQREQLSQDRNSPNKMKQVKQNAKPPKQDSRV